MIGDLRKFSYSNAKNLKPELLKTGWGEHVCAVIDELLNLELYRREFQFNNPVFPQEPDDDEGDDFENEGVGIGGDSVILLNGGGGQIEIREGGNLLVDEFGATVRQGPLITKKNRMQNNAEETKINFFAP